MLSNSSNTQNDKSYSKTTNITKENIICKDGFCSLQNQNEIIKKDTKDMNLFDPI